MEVALCAQEVSNHPVLLMARLNLQRKKGQFCDCVLRLRDNPGQLHPAHRCVLAASSPVLSSMLSSTGVLVELEAPYFSDSVLPPLLDYLYTGSLTHSQSQQQYHSLLTAACYLQMDELIGALRAWKTELKFADNVNDLARAENLPHEDVNTKSMDNFCDPPSASCISAFRRPEEMHTSRTWSSRDSLEKDTHQSISDKEAFKEDKMNSVHMDTSKDMETSVSRTDTKHGGKHWKRTNSSSSREPGISCSELKRVESRVNPHQVPQDFIQNVQSTAGVTNMDKEVHEDMFYSSETVKSGIWQKHSDKDFGCLIEDGRSSSAVSRPCCGAVPVICHSGTTSTLQLAEVPPHQPGSQAALSFNRTSVLQSTNGDSDKTVEGVSTEYKHGAQKQTPQRHNENQTGALNQDHKEGLNQCAAQDMCCKWTEDRSAHNSIDPDDFVRHDNGYLTDGSSHNALSNIQHGHYDPWQNKTKYLKDYSLPQNKKTGFYDFSKYKQQNSFESYSFSMETEPEEHSANLRHAVPLSGGETQYEDDIPEGEVQKEHSYSSSPPGKIDIQVSQRSIYGRKTNQFSNICWAEKSKQDAASVQQKNNSHDTEHKDNNADRPSIECHTSMEPETIITEPQLTLTMSVDSDMRDSMYSAMSQKYHGHLHYHYLPDEDSHLSHEKHSQTHIHLSDRSGDIKEACIIDCSSFNPKYHDDTEATEQVFLLDISTKPAELLVSCRRTSDREEESDGQRDTYISELTKTERRTPEEDQTRPGSCKAEAVDEVSCFKEGDNQISTWTVCSPSSVSDSVQASMSSTTSVNMPSSPSASVPKNTSTHQSTPINHSFQCTLCERSFSQRGSLNRHVRSHLGVRPFPCPRCPMTFSRQYRVTEHMRVHQRCVFENDLPKPSTSST